MLFDRADGKLLRHTDPMYRVAAHIMAKRSDAMNSITLDITSASSRASWIPPMSP